MMLVIPAGLPAYLMTYVSGAIPVLHDNKLSNKLSYIIKGVGGSKKCSCVRLMFKTCGDVPAPLKLLRSHPWV